MVYRGLFSYRQRVRVITVFPNIFLVLFLLIQELKPTLNDTVSSEKLYLY